MSLFLRCLKNRSPAAPNIIVTRSPGELANDPRYTFENVLVVTSIEEALTKAKTLDSEEIFFGGGSQIYEQALP